jgi:hypothetical protein
MPLKSVLVTRTLRSVFSTMIFSVEIKRSTSVLGCVSPSGAYVNRQSVTTHIRNRQQQFSRKTSCSNNTAAPASRHRAMRLRRSSSIQCHVAERSASCSDCSIPREGETIDKAVWAPPCQSGHSGSKEGHPISARD